MDVFVARQPIFDRQRQLYAYELLYRSEACQNRDASIEVQKRIPSVNHRSRKLCVNSGEPIGIENRDLNDCRQTVPKSSSGTHPFVDTELLGKALTDLPHTGRVHGRVGVLSGK